MPFPIIDVRATGQNIDRLIKERQISVRTLQTYFGFDTPRAIYKWLRGEHLPSVDHLFALSKLLRVPMQDILIEQMQDDQDVHPIFKGSLREFLMIYMLNQRGNLPMRLTTPSLMEGVILRWKPFGLTENPPLGSEKNCNFLHLRDKRGFPSTRFCVILFGGFTRASDKACV